ncbi:MAG TPA: heme exporter protein CcmD [Micavibrio sp.]|jgi:heme exporter protein D
MNAEFFAMNGYALYIWGSYGFAAFALGLLCLSTFLKSRRHKDKE